MTPRTKNALIRKLLIFAFIGHPFQGARANVRVAIDPGHGGVDKGATHAQVFESKIALEISQKLHKKLKKAPGISSFLTRTTNRELRLHSRVLKAKKQKADLFISIHANSNPNPKASGAEFYIQSQMPPEEEMLFLANRENQLAHKTQDQAAMKNSNVDNILYDLKKNRRILESFQLSWHFNKAWRSSSNRNQIRQGPFYVLSQNNIPSVLVEVGYISNPRERKKLQQSQYQSEVVEKIYRGLKAYLNNNPSL